MFLKNKPALSLRGSVTTAAITCLLLLIACGDDTTEVISGQNYIEIVAEESDLPECSEDNEGEQVLVKGENIARTCVDGEWTAAFTPGRDTVYLKNKDISCYTKELADKQGVKIICDGDSVGVLLNGSEGTQGDKGDKGDKGADGAGCSLEQLDSVTARLVCGADTMTVYLGLPPDTTKTVPTDEIDSEKIPVSLDSLVGYAQFGWFSSADDSPRLYGLGDGRMLKRSGGFYTSKNFGRKGYYKFDDFEFPSQYAMLDFEVGFYNLCYEEGFRRQIRLRALVDLSERTSANVNVLTELEFDRVKYLVTQEGMTVKQAKKQAQSEIFAQFYIDAKDFDASETLDIFWGESDAETALLAVSLLLQTGGDEMASHPLDEVEQWVHDIAAAIETTGTWSGDVADAKKTLIADVALEIDFAFIRRNIERHRGSGSISNFEKHIKNYIEHVYAMEPCGEGSESELRIVNNEKSRYHGNVFHCHEGVPTVESKNTFTNPEITYGRMIDLRDRHAYKIVTVGKQTWMAENLNLNSRVRSYFYPELNAMGCLKNDCDVYGRGYTWSKAIDAKGYYSANSLYCDSGDKCNAVYPVQGICPEGWHLPDTTEFRTLIDALGGSQNAGRVLKSTSGWVNEEGEGENGIDSVGFSMLPTLENVGYIWSATYCNEECSNNGAYYMGVDGLSGEAVISKGVRNSEYSVRCIKDSAE